ncbi:beta/gamma crystallin-related protein [Candidatus Poribacteria bacterium]
MPIAPRLIVEVFRDPNYRGKKVTIVDSTTDTATIGCHDMISSIKVYRGPGFDSSPNFKAVFYDQTNFIGRKMALNPGFYPNIHSIPYNFGDSVSSIQFGPAQDATGPDYGSVPLIVELYTDTDLRGTKGVVLRDVSRTRDIGLDNIVSSIKVIRGPNFPATGCRAIFFEQPNFEGANFSLTLGRLEFEKTITDLHMHPQRFGDIISSVKIAPTGVFNVLVVVGDTRTAEPPLLAGFTELEGNKFNFRTVVINSNPNNRGDPGRAISLNSIDLSEFDIIWLTWNAPGHDNQYFLAESESAIRDFVANGGTVWASAMDNNIRDGKWRGGWLPIEEHPIEVVGSEDANVTITPTGANSGLFSWPNKLDPNNLITDDHWITSDRAYRVLATRRAVIEVLIVVSDSRTSEHEVLQEFKVMGGNNFAFDMVHINSNTDNYGNPEARKLGSVDLSKYDILWFTWNGPAHDREYFVADADELIRNFVARGGVVWASAMDDNIIEGRGWRGTWMPVHRHPIRVVNSSDSGILITALGNTTGLFSQPHRINVDALVTDDHWVTTDKAYVPLAVRKDNGDPAGLLLRWGAGYYVAFAVDTRDKARTQAARPLIQNALNYVAKLVSLTGEYVGFQLKYGRGRYVAFAVDTRDPSRGQLAKPLLQNGLCYVAGLAWQTSLRQLHGVRREKMAHSIEF